MKVKEIESLKYRIKSINDELYALKHIEFKRKKDGMNYTNPNLGLLFGKIQKNWSGTYVLYATVENDNDRCSCHVYLNYGMENTVENWKKCVENKIINLQTEILRLTYTIDFIESFETDFNNLLGNIFSNLRDNYEIEKFDYTLRNQIVSEALVNQGFWVE